MSIKITSSFGFFFFFVFVAVSFQNCVSPRERSIAEWEERQWKIVKTDKNEEPAWIIYSRKLGNTNFLEYKIEGEVRSSPIACISSFKKDIHNLADDPDNKKYPLYQIIQESKDSLLTYVIHKEPFPFKNTEMSVRYLFSRSTDKNTEKVKWKEAWDDVSIPPPSKKLSRVETFRGGWHFSITPTNSSLAVNSVQFDPKKMPLWLIKPMVVKFLVEGLENIREMTSGK